MSEIWVLGASGRSGRAIAANLAMRRMSPVLVGRDATRLSRVVGEIGEDLPIMALPSVAAIVSELSRKKPAVVVNTIGPFTETAWTVAMACPPGKHYVDLSNDLSSIVALLGVHDKAASSGCTFVTGAGFGVLATESIVLKLCEGQPLSAKVRVDAVPSVDSGPGQVGSALAASIIDSLVGGGRRYSHGQLERSRLFSDIETFNLPDGSPVKTAAVPTGDLEAARRASGASFVVAASSMAATAPVVRGILPAVAALLRITLFRNLAKRHLAAVEVKPRKRDREFSWTHARVEWDSGQVREGWLCADEAMAFTA